MRIIKKGFNNLGVITDEYLEDIEVQREAIQTLSRLFAFNPYLERFQLMEINSNGQLRVTSESSKTETVIQSVASITSAGNVILAENPQRKAFILQNNSSSIIKFNLDNSYVAATAITLPIGGFFSDDLYYGVIYGASVAASANLTVIEYL